MNCGDSATPVTVRAMLPPRLSDRTLAQARNDAWPGAYDRGAVEIGVVHLGPGAFHRAHQAPVFDQLLAADRRWGVCGVSLRSAAVREALAPQDGLYTLVELDAEPRVHIVGAVKQLLTAPQAPAAVLARLASVRTRMITLTVTEKGYCLTADGELDLAHPDVAHDLARPPTPRSAVGWLAEGLRARRAARAPGLSVVSCDNLTNNGAKLAEAVTALAEAQGDADLADWARHEIRFPNTMVDSITPATDEPLTARVRELIGLDDAWPIQREGFTQWVIEDRLTPGGPDLASAGVTLVGDVRPFEQAKLRLLNGAHSTLAYLGLLAGLSTVAEAMADPVLAGFVERLMRDDIAPTLTRTAALDRGRLHRRHPGAVPQSGDPPPACPDRLGRLSEAAVPAARDHRRRARRRAASGPAGGPGGGLECSPHAGRAAPSRWSTRWPRPSPPSPRPRRLTSRRAS